MLTVGCDPQKRDFQSQSFLDLVQILDNQEMKEWLIAFLVNQTKEHLYLKMKNSNEVDKEKILNEFLKIEEKIRTSMDEMPIVDPLMISQDEMIAFTMGLILMIAGATNEFLGDWSFYMQGAATIALVLGYLSEMSCISQNSGKLQYPLIVFRMLSQFMPPVRSVYTAFKVGVLSLSLINTYKAFADNISFRKFDSVKKCVVNSFNFYHFVSNAFNLLKLESKETENATLKNTKISAELCKEFKALKVKYHPDKGGANDDAVFLNEIYGYLNSRKNYT